MYDNLKPGIYIQTGKEVKPLKNFGVLESILQGETENPQSLASRVPYVYAALDRRKARVIEIEYEWKKGDAVTQEAPVKIRLKNMLQRTDEALQLIGAAYWYKLRAGGRLVGFRWLDPRTMKPDENSIVNPIGYQNYIRSTTKGTVNIPAEDLVVFQEYGLAEYAPGGIAGVATALAVEVLYSVQKAERTTYDNPLPVSMVIVPQGTSEASKNDLKGFMQRVFNRNPKTTPEYRVMPVYEGTSIERISMTPQELSFESARDPNALAVLAAHGVPASEVFGVSGGLGNGESTGSSNDTRSFIKRIGSRLDYIAEELSYDEEFSKLGWELKFYPDRHTEMQANENETSQAFTSYLQGFTPEAAAYLVGITQADFPEGMTIFPEAIEVEPVAESEPEPPQKSQAVHDEIAKWYKKAKRVGGWCEFESDIIPADLHAEISAALKAQKDERGIKSLFADYLGDPIMPEDNKVEKLLDGVIKALQDEPEPKSEPQPINVTVNNDDATSPAAIAELVAKTVSDALTKLVLPTPEVTVMNEVEKPVVQVEVTNEVQPSKVIIKEAPAPNVKVDVNLEQVKGMYTEYNRNRNGDIESAETEMINE